MKYVQSLFAYKGNTIKPNQ